MKRRRQLFWRKACARPVSLSMLPLAATRASKFDLLIVDIMLPKKDGWALVEELREARVQTPVIFLTARDSVRDRVKGLELGADDYVVKPFAFSELLARVRSLLRRTPSRRGKLRIDDLEIDTRHQRAERGGVPLNLRPKEFLRLTHLAHSVGEVVSRAEIAEHVWDIGFKTDTNVVDVVVRRLRAKVDDPFKTKLVHTIRGMGYVLKATSPPLPCPPAHPALSAGCGRPARLRTWRFLFDRCPSRVRRRQRCSGRQDIR